LNGGYRYLQLLVRMWINVEALNMVESVGNVTRRRTVPMIVAKGPGSYVVRWVPAISGETLAHRYQEEIVTLASSHSGCSKRIDYWSAQGEFLKHWDLKFYDAQCQKASKGEAPKPRDWECELAKNYANLNNYSINHIAEIERIIVSNSVVEDIAGFLVTQGPTRRTSCIRFSYMIPTIDSIDSSQMDHQMHVRGALKAQSLRIEGYEEAIQIPYYVQIGSVVYGLNIELEMERVGCYSIAEGCVNDHECSINDRRCIALYALRPILDGDFGAKRSRYLPHTQLEIAVAIASSRPIPTPPATLPFRAMLEELKTKLNDYRDLGTDYEVHALIPSGLPYSANVEDLVKSVLGDINVHRSSIKFLKALEQTLKLDCSALVRGQGGS